MTTRILATLLYSLFGLLYLLAGGSVLLLGTGLLPPAVQELLEAVGHEDVYTEHIMQEFGSLLVFAGLITFWFVRHYDRSWAFHWTMTIFWVLIALVHWFDVRGSFQYGRGPLINTIPFGLFLLVGLLRWKTEKPTQEPAFPQ